MDSERFLIIAGAWVVGFTVDIRWCVIGFSIRHMFSTAWTNYELHQESQRKNVDYKSSWKL